MTPILKAPEVVAEVGKQTGLKPKQVADIFENDFLSMLTPIEKKRLVQILIEHVTVNEDIINIEFRTENIKSIQEAYCEQNP